jgi:hypothetical protein
MFVRFRRTPSRLQVSLVEPHRVDGKVRQEHIAALGSVAWQPMTIAGRIEFWRKFHERFDNLDNRIGDQKIKILNAIHARIPMVTMDEIRALQRENAETDVKFWSGLQGLNTDFAEGNKALAVIAASKAAAAETLAKDAAGKVTVAKERLDKLANGETITGGIGEPLTREWAKKILLDDGWTAAEIRLAFGLAKLSEAEFDVFVDMGTKAMHQADKVIMPKHLREILAKRKA